MSGTDCQSGWIDDVVFIRSAVDDPSDVVVVSDVVVISDDEHGLTSADPSGMHGIEKIIQSRHTIDVEGFDPGYQPERRRFPGCQPEDQRFSEAARFRVRPEKLHVARLRARLAKVREDRYRAMKAFDAVVRETKQMQVRKRLWKGVIAIRKRCIYSGRKERHFAKADRVWAKERLKRLGQELMPLRRESAALEIEGMVQEENTIKWTNRLKNIHEECAALEEVGEEPWKQHKKWRVLDEKLKAYTSMLAADADAASRQRTLLMPPRIRRRPA